MPATTDYLTTEDRIDIGGAIATAANALAARVPRRVVVTSADHFDLARAGADAIDRTPENLTTAEWDWICDVASAAIGWAVSND